MNILLFSMMLMFVGNSMGTEPLCASPHTSVLKFSITSRRNLTGHLVAQVKFGHGAGHKESGPWEVDIDHTTTYCEEGESVEIDATVIAPPKGPGKDYELFHGLGYYKFHTTQKNWLEANEVCVSEGAHLAVVNSQDEADVLLKFMKRENGSVAIAVGFHDRITEGNYVTIFGQHLNSTGYVKWGNGEPNPVHTAIEDCGTFREQGVFNDVPCDYKYPFICEHEIM